MTRPNVVLITIDSFRADHAGFINNNISDTPKIDSLANKATLATRGTAPSSHTRASVPAILTSQYSHNFFSTFLEQTNYQTIASTLSNIGYTTAAFHSNPLLSRHFGYDEGYDTFYDGLRFTESTNLPESVIRLYSKIIRIVRRYPYEPASKITKKALSWLNTTTEPFFLWVHYMDPHGPYALNRSKGFIDKFASERLWRKAVENPEEITPKEHNKIQKSYRNEIGFTDKHLEPLLEEINERDSTAVVLTGDHGEEFGEHGSYSHHPKLYDEITQVPLIIDFPEYTNPSPSPQPISLLDIVPTILDIIEGVNFDKTAGQSLCPVFDGEDLNRDHVICETNLGEEPIIGVRTETWKYIEYPGNSELFNIVSDPKEQTDVSGKYPTIQSELAEHVRAHLKEYSIQGGDKLATVREDMNTELRDRLDDLGYL